MPEMNIAKKIEMLIGDVLYDPGYDGDPTTIVYYIRIDNVGNLSYFPRSELLKCIDELETRHRAMISNHVIASAEGLQRSLDSLNKRIAAGEC